MTNMNTITKEMVSKFFSARDRVSIKMLKGPSTCPSCIDRPRIMRKYVAVEGRKVATGPSVVEVIYS